MNNKLKIFEDHIQKRIGALEKQIDRNCLTLYQEYKVFLDEAYTEGIVEYETLLSEYYMKEQEINRSLQAELTHLYETCIPVKVVDLDDIYFAHGVH